LSHLQKSTGGQVTAQRSLSPERSSSKEERETRWTGALVHGCNESFPVESAVLCGPADRTRPFAATPSVAEGAVSDTKTDSRQAGCATPRKAGSGCPQGQLGTRGGALAGKSPGYRMRDRRSRERKKSSASPVERRRSGPGKASSRHGGGVEAVSASLSESANVHRERHVPVSKRESRQGRQR